MQFLTANVPEDGLYRNFISPHDGKWGIRMSVCLCVCVSVCLCVCVSVR
jgi:hypothetical protein